MNEVLAFIIENLPVLICMVVGIALLIVEIFMPGFGLPGISGILLLVVSIVITWLNHGPLVGLGLTIVTLALIGISVTVSLRSAESGKLSKSAFILRDSDQSAGYMAAKDKDMEALLDKTGVSATVLRPAGLAEFDGVKLNVVSDGAFIDKGKQVKISHVEGTKIIVKEING